MKIFEDDTAVVNKGIFTGFRFVLKGTGRIVKPTAWMKHRMGELHQALKSANLNAIDDDEVRELFWMYFIELAQSPPNGLLHSAVASEPISAVVQEFASQLGRGRTS